MKKITFFLFAIIAITILSCSSTNDGNTTTVVPVPPTNLTGNVISASQVNLSWVDNSTNETGFKIERRIETGTFAIVGTVSADILTFNDINLTPETPFIYRVYSYNAVGNSPIYSNVITLTTKSIIGSPFQGGVIAYVLKSGDPGYKVGEVHGLIAAPNDQGKAQWGCYGTVISGADGKAIGTGNQNTTDIINGCSTAGIAARLCGNLVLGGYSDWYLPSQDEIARLYSNRAAIGGFASDSYWSSTETSNNTAWWEEFANGTVSSFNSNKNITFFNVRAIRSF